VLLHHGTKDLYARAGYDVVTNPDGSLTATVREGRDRHLCAACIYTLRRVLGWSA
jgi:hypothetical protein